MTDRKQAELRRSAEAARDQNGQPEPEYVKNFQGDGALGANTAYGNTPRNTGARFDADEP